MPLFLIFVILTGLAILAWHRFSWAVVCVCVALPLYLIRFTVMHIPTNLFEMSVVLVVIIGLWQPLVRRQFLSFWYVLSPTIRWSVALFILASTISVGISPSFVSLTQPDILHSLGIWKSWVILPILLAGCVGSVSFSHRSSSDYILKAVVFSAVVVACLGLLQNPFAGRIASVYDVPNSLALFLVPVAVVLIWRSWRHTTLIIGIVLAALVATQSIMAVLSLVVTCIIGFWLYRPVIILKTRQKILLGLGLILIASLCAYRLPYFIQPFINQETHSSLSVRFQVWRIAGRLVVEHPLLGIGLGRFEPAYQALLHEDFSDYGSGIRDQKPLAEFVFRDPHNAVFSFWLNTGLLGLVAFLIVNVSVIRRAFSARVSPALSLALLSLGVFGLADTIYWKNDLAALHWVLLTLIFIETYTAYYRNFGSST